MKESHRKGESDPSWPCVLLLVVRSAAGQFAQSRFQWHAPGRSDLI